MTEELRRNRRVQGHPPEFGLLLDSIKGPRKMPDSKETAPKLLDDTNSVPVSVPHVPILTYQLPRNPCIFSGDDQQDANKWLEDFQRIATYNHWDDQMCMANVIFYLAGTARQWFNNNEGTFSNFTTFRNSLNNAFCRRDDIRRQAERLLLTRAQQIGETSESYIQNVLSLCQKANPSMSEDEKVAHLMKGIAEDLYQTLLFQDFITVDEFVKRCREIESLERRRITRTRFQRLPNVSAVSAENDVGDIRSLIREIVREEFGKVLPEMQYYTNDEPESPPDIASMVRKEVMETLSPLAAPRQRNSIPRRNTTSRRSVSVRSPPIRREARNSAVPMRKTDLWRVDSNVPLCYHCGRPGHVLRYCRERRQIFADSRAARKFNPQRDADTKSTQSFEDSYAQPTSSSFRSNLPYPRRSRYRRQSQSPLRRSSLSPRRPNEEN
ncbi:hypothetical protein AVEN_139494-1 [Araneus ventricosus]|uniref:CCHC-type domain-containing protein n=1 Tax=Araneus ventricosus TaxID=182803 RepID=A0A4Y2QKF3_ARAVE|nr:hypothetical protein AVEN_139494-1 [Araneus ventricosus]